MQAIIADTETTGLKEPVPVEIAYLSDECYSTIVFYGRFATIKKSTDKRGYLSLLMQELGNFSDE